MIWMLLIALSPDTYAVRNVYMTKYECEQHLEIEWDMCWPADLSYTQPPDRTFYVLNPENQKKS